MNAWLHTWYSVYEEVEKVHGKIRPCPKLSCYPWYACKYREKPRTTFSINTRPWTKNRIRDPQQLNRLLRYSTTTFSLTFSRLMTHIYIYIYIYICRTAPLTSRCCILYIYSTNIRTEYFKYATHSPFFPFQNAVYFIMLPFLVPILFTI